MRTRGRRHLDTLLAERNRNPDDAVRVDGEIFAAFRRRVAVLALDLCDFTETTSRHGIIHYLALIDEMARTVRPLVRAAGGRVVKQEADNLFAIFPGPQAALETALRINLAFAASNATAPAERQLAGCFGIGYGDALLVGRTDLFGPEVNLACKLGEDVAGRHEILLTRAAAETLPEGRYRMTERRHILSGREIEAFLVTERTCQAD